MLKTIIFTTAYNAQHTIRRAVESILNQTHTSLEYYVLDNGSTDDTANAIIEYSKIDERIKLIQVNKNDIANGGAFFHTIVHATNAKYIVWCDADDEYTLDFLENMIGFAEEDQLDIAACGYEKIDGNTNEVLKHRALTENLVIHDSLFVEKFIKYRGFTTYLWGKLYSIPFLKAKKHTGTEEKSRICNDSIWTLGLFKKADRAGIYGKAMYKYYQYPRSLSHTNIEESLSSYSDLWNATNQYLKSYGPISKTNEDFLYAIHLSLVEEAVEKVFASEMVTDIQLRCLLKIFDDPIWVETMARDADPQFRNLAARAAYVDGVKNNILALPGAAEKGTAVAKIFRRLEST